MQHSKSVGSFSSDSTAAPILRNHSQNRPQSRSSMDTFLIPGRTRIPSNHPQTADFQIAEALLESNLALPRRILPIDMPSNELKKDKDGKSTYLFDYLGIDDGDSSKNSKEKARSDQKPHRRAKSVSLETDSTARPLVRSEISKSPAPRMGTRDAIIIPARRRSRKVGDNPPPIRAVPTPPPRKNGQLRKPQGIYDGAIGSSYESRTTSMTWSTVSHRVLSESSADVLGMGASENLNEFNRLAIQHGVPELEKCPGGKFV